MIDVGEALGTYDPKKDLRKKTRYKILRDEAALTLYRPGRETYGVTIFINWDGERVNFEGPNTEDVGPAPIPDNKDALHTLLDSMFEPFFEDQEKVEEGGYREPRPLPVALRDR